MRVNVMIKRIIHQFLRDKRTLAMMIVAPIFILWLVSLVFSSEPTHPIIGLVKVNESIVDRFKERGAIIYEYNAEDEAILAVENGEIDGYLVLDENLSPMIVIEGSNPTNNKMVLETIKHVLASQQEQSVLEPIITYFYGSDTLTTFDNVGPFLIGFFVFFFVFLIAGVSFLRERTSGTLEKLLSTPLKRWEIVVGYVLGFGIFTTVQSAIIVIVSVYALDMIMYGSIWLVMLVTLTLSVTALTLGTLLSTFARNELQMIQFIPVVIVPQVFFSGLFNIDAMTPWLQTISVIMPLTYGGEALRDIMIRGKDVIDISRNILILLGFSCVFMILNSLALKKHRKL